jgi:vitamin B12/bleomycin/antimicrobial peptide transport system ATP-binding/permease protein
MEYMPPRPYVPLGTLRTGVSYPAAPERFEDLSVARALERVGLRHLAPSLDREERWDQTLSLEEQQCLAFARLLLHRPRWILLDDALGALGALGALDEDDRQSMLSIFEDELAASAVVSIGRSPARRGFYDRTLHMRRLGESASLVPLRPRQRRAQSRATRALVRPIRASA